MSFGHWICSICTCLYDLILRIFMVLSSLLQYTTGEITGKIVSGHHLSFLSEKSGDEVADIINRTVLP